ncbi:HIRAN domain-containing protein [Mycoplasma sp. P36-A1]|uniref:HIRAN domain-containing protein n=1 Tax=Mycoplasma sp. P36-A1 TaxID=3252900 RepID=UPI003C2C62F7
MIKNKIKELFQTIVGLDTNSDDHTKETTYDIENEIYIYSWDYMQTNIKKMLDHYSKIVDKETIYYGKTDEELVNDFEVGQKIFQLPITKDIQTRLIKEPQNKHDRNAVKVVCVLDGKTYHIGYIPSEINKSILSKMNKIDNIILYIFGGKFKMIESNKAIHEYLNDHYSVRIKINYK